MRDEGNRGRVAQAVRRCIQSMLRKNSEKKTSPQSAFSLPKDTAKLALSKKKKKKKEKRKEKKRKKRGGNHLNKKRNAT
jgi:hypothetical protein